jgi:glycerophosphoryl diester phosphodiesterase
MAAFRRAADMGAGFIETDLHLTRDAQVVAIHDPTVDRTTNGHGKVQSLKLEQVRALDAGSWFKAGSTESFSGEHVPTLPEILTFARERDLIFYLEIKSDAGWGIEHAVVATLRDFGEAARVIILSFDSAALESVHHIDETMMTGYLCEYPASDLVERAVRAGARQLAPRSDLVTSDLIAKAHRAGLQVVAWTVNEPEQMRRLEELGVDGIMTDYPDRLVAVMRKTKVT